MESLEVTAEFWRDRRVLITGHTGFKGSWLSLWLQSLGARVTGFALPLEDAGGLFALARVGEGMTSLAGDVRDLPALSAALAQHAPEVVIHMAAQALVRESYVDPVGTYGTNVMGTVNLLEAVRRTSSVKAVVVVTSDKCYENREWAWAYRENEPMGGHDPYSNSKGCAELVVAAYRRSFFDGAASSVGVASGRAGNVIGGGDCAVDRLVPDLIRSIAAKRPMLVRNPRAIRPWQHVLDPLHGYLTLAEKLCGDATEYSQGWNFGPADSDGKPVSWIVTQLVERWGEGAEWQIDAGEAPHEAHYLKLDSSLARSRLGWLPRVDLGEALGWIVAWHKANLRGEDMRSVTLAQIRAFERC